MLTALLPASVKNCTEAFLSRATQWRSNDVLLSALMGALAVLVVYLSRPSSSKLDDVVDDEYEDGKPRSAAYREMKARIMQARREDMRNRSRGSWFAYVATFFVVTSCVYVALSYLIARRGGGALDYRSGTGSQQAGGGDGAFVSDVQDSVGGRMSGSGDCDGNMEDVLMYISTDKPAF